jgi:Fur family transcriptional regulator, zinc uptake regulator
VLPDQHGGGAQSVPEKPSDRVLAVLTRAGVPLKAYDILRALSRDGRHVHPPTVYRALERLQAAGKVHKLESQGSYVICAADHGPGSVVHHHADDAMMAFLICTSCGDHREVHSCDLQQAIDGLTAAHGFKPQRPILEILGRCAACALASEAAS